MLLTLTWKNEVDPRVMIGERTSGLEMTWILNTSEIDRLRSVRSRPQAHFTSVRNKREMRTSPFWLNTKKACCQLCYTVLLTDSIVLLVNNKTIPSLAHGRRRTGTLVVTLTYETRVPPSSAPTMARELYNNIHLH